MEPRLQFEESKKAITARCSLPTDTSVLRFQTPAEQSATACVVAFALACKAAIVGEGDTTQSWKLSKGGRQDVQVDPFVPDPLLVYLTLYVTTEGGVAAEKVGTAGLHV